MDLFAFGSMPENAFE